MEENNKRTAAEQIAESDAAIAQPQPATAQDGTTARTAPAVVGNEATTTKSQTVVTVSKMSPQEQQYLKAIALSSAELGAVIEKSTERVTNNLGEAIGTEAEAKSLRLEAKKKFDDNIAFYYEAKLCNSSHPRHLDPLARTSRSHTGPRTLTLQYTQLTRKAGGSILPSPYTTPSLV